MGYEVSVVIPVYNGENKLHYSINSLLEQQHNSLEIVVINDGSDDATEGILNDYAMKYSNIIIHNQSNSGVSKARNKGIELATGKYLCFLDADDYYDKNYIIEMTNKIKSNQSKVCYCGYKVITPNSNQNKKSVFSNRNLLKKYILGQLAVHTTGWMIERQFLLDNSIRFPEGVSWGEDFEFFCEVLATTNEITYVNKYLTNYRIGFEENQLSTFSIDKIEKDKESIFRLLNNKKVCFDNKVKDILLNYRLQALIVYRLMLAFEYNIDKETINSYYKDYQEYLKTISKCNGFRSLKIELAKIKLAHKLNQR